MWEEMITIYIHVFLILQGPELELYVLNSLAPGKFELNIRYVIFKHTLVIDGC